jgi:hypothetical protein
MDIYTYDASTYIYVFTSIPMSIQILVYMFFWTYKRMMLTHTYISTRTYESAEGPPFANVYIQILVYMYVWTYIHMMLTHTYMYTPTYESAECPPFAYTNTTVLPQTLYFLSQDISNFDSS